VVGESTPQTLAETANVFSQALAAGRSSEVDRGITLFGPHRDDVEFSLNGLPAKGYASHGETWSYALSLRLGAARLLRSESVLGDPILILDDVFAELDTSRRERLAMAVSDFEQVFITAAVRHDVPEALLQQVFAVDKGTIVRSAD
jgi:DNA replication and repair protein RecF